MVKSNINTVFSIDNALLIYNAHHNIFVAPFDAVILSLVKIFFYLIEFDLPLIPLKCVLHMFIFKEFILFV
jgi:hypothetical protein